MQKAVFGCEFDIACADAGAAGGGTAIALGQGRGELKIRCCTVIEIDAALTGGPAARRRSVGERIDLEMLVVGRFRIVGNVGRSGNGVLRQQRQDAAGNS